LTLLPLVITMMVFSPISGALIGRIGTRRLLSLGMFITGLSALLFLRVDVNARFLDLVPVLVVMGFGNSLIFAPMTTAVLNSVETEKSGVASAVNGAVRETGFAFGVALLGTIMNRTYQGKFAASSEIRALGDSSNPAAAALKPVLSFIGSGVNYAGRLIQDPQLFPGLPEQVTATIREASSRAFIVGMERAFVLSSAVIIAFSVFSYFLIQDSVAQRRPAEREADGGLAIEPAD